MLSSSSFATPFLLTTCECEETILREVSAGRRKEQSPVLPYSVKVFTSASLSVIINIIVTGDYVLAVLACEASETGPVLRPERLPSTAYLREPM